MAASVCNSSVTSSAMARRACPIDLTNRGPTNRDVAGREVGILSDHLAIERRQKEALKAEHKASTEERESTEERLRRLDQERQAMQAVLDELAQENKANRARIECVSNERANILRKCDTQRKRRAQLQNSVASLAKAVDLQRDKITLCEAEDTEMHKQYEDIEEEVLAAKNDLEDAEHDLEQARLREEKASEQQRAVQVAITESKAQKKALESQLGLIESERMRLLSQVRAATTEMRKLDLTLSQLTADRKRQQTRMEKTERTLVALREETNGEREEHEDVMQHVQELQGSKAQMARRMHELSKQSSSGRAALVHEQRSQQAKVMANVANVKNARAAAEPAAAAPSPARSMSRPAAQGDMPTSRKGSLAPRSTDLEAQRLWEELGMSDGQRVDVESF